LFNVIEDAPENARRSGHLRGSPEPPSNPPDRGSCSEAPTSGSVCMLRARSIDSSSSPILVRASVRKPVE